MTKQLKFCGWGYEGEGLSAAEQDDLLAECADRFGADELPRISVPQADEITLTPPRVEVPANLRDFCTNARRDRLTHTYGKAYLEYVAMFDRDYGHAPDVVAYVRNEDDIVARHLERVNLGEDVVLVSVDRPDSPTLLKSEPAQAGSCELILRDLDARTVAEQKPPRLWSRAEVLAKI